MVGHLGITKTKDRVLQRNYWPGVFHDITQCCCSCEVYQRDNNHRSGKVAMVSMPLISCPIERIAMDLIGPLPKSKEGNKFILTIVDYATRYPEAVALPSTEASQIARGLLLLFSKVHIPK